MGYYVNIVNSTWRVKGDKLNEAYEAMCALNTTHDAEKRGGSWGPGGKTEKWFSWMPANYPEVFADAKTILEELGFEVEEENDGSLFLSSYDSKIGQEDLFLKAIAPYSEGFIEWHGEDDAIWKDAAEGGKFVQKRGRVVYDYDD